MVRYAERLRDRRVKMALLVPVQSTTMSNSVEILRLPYQFSLYPEPNNGLKYLRSSFKPFEEVARKFFGDITWCSYSGRVHEPLI